MLPAIAGFLASSEHALNPEMWDNGFAKLSDNGLAGTKMELSS